MSEADQKRRIAELKESGKLLENEKGKRFYYRALSPKAKKRKKARRKMRKKSRG